MSVMQTFAIILIKCNQILIALIFSGAQSGTRGTNLKVVPSCSLLLILRILLARRDNERPWVPVVAFSSRSKSHEADGWSQGNNRRHGLNPLTARFLDWLHPQTYVLVTTVHSVSAPQLSASPSSRNIGISKWNALSSLRRSRALRV